MMAARPLRGVRTALPSRCDIDVHEMLKQELFKQTPAESLSSSYQAPPATSAPMPGTEPLPRIEIPERRTVGFEDIWIYFDSLSRDSDSDYSRGEIKWDIPKINNLSDIKNCIQIHIGSFYLPKISPPAANKPEQLYFNRMYMEYVNAPTSQAVLANGSRFHFEFEIENLSGQAVKLVPLEESFFFQRPIQSINSFHVRFMVPPGLRGIKLPPDTVTVQAIPGSNPIRFNIIGETTDVISGGTIGALNPGVAVQFSGLNTNDFAVNSAINDPYGVFVTQIISATEFEIGDIDGSAIDTAAPYTASMFIMKNRIAFAVRFTIVTDHATNHIGVVHD